MKFLGPILILTMLSVFFVAKAEDYSSLNFILRDPVMMIEGGESTSSSFVYLSGTGQTTGGENTSLSFIHRAGFLYFPVATAPTLSASAGNGLVNLSWTASVGTLANITSYDVGISGVSGGPYTFETVGNTLSFSKTGLTNGTTYYFQVRANAGILTLAKSNEASAAPSGPVTPPSLPITGGGGVSAPLKGTVTLEGRAYPLSNITILKDGQIALTTIAGPDAKFNVAVSGLSTGNYIFSVYSEDNKGNRSTLFNFPLYITVGTVANISGIFLAPTIFVDKSEVVRGDNVAIFGQSAAKSEITIGVSSEEELFVKTNADKDGVYLYNFDTSILDFGKHFTRSKAALEGAITSFSRTVSFLVGTKTILSEPPTIQGPPKADLNRDGRLNLIDFSITAYWYKRPLDTQFRQIEKEIFNGDGKIDLVDFSIMAYYWTG